MKLIIFVISGLFLKITICNSQTIENKINFKTNNIYPTFIKAGQDSGCGIKYYDIVPNDVLNPVYGNFSDSAIYDLDSNGTADFVLKYTISDQSMLGLMYNYYYITPLGGNSICVSNNNINIADSLRFSDVIDSNKTWSNTKAYLYHYYNLMGSPLIFYGYWLHLHNYYIGVRINSGGHILYGWIDASFNHIISQFAVTVPYSNADIIMTNTNNAIVNSGANINIHLTSNIPTSYTWIANDNPNTIGESITLQSTNIINDTIKNNSDTIQFITYTVTPTEIDCGGIAIQQTIIVTVYPSVGIYENNLNNKINIFPNPFSTETTIKTTESFTNTTLTIYNIFGQQIREITNINGRTITINRENLPNGIYLICIKQSNFILAKNKLIIINN